MSIETYYSRTTFALTFCAVINTAMCCQPILPPIFPPQQTTTFRTTARTSTTTRITTSEAPNYITETSTIEPIDIHRCENVKIGSLPFQVTLIGQTNEDEEATHFCSGTILNEDSVLTAASCLFDPKTKKQLKTEDIVAAAGEEKSLNVWEGTEQIVLIKEVIFYDKYEYNSSNQHYDIAVLRLMYPYQFDEHVSPISLPPKDFEIYTAENITVTGWNDAQMTIKDDKTDLQKMNKRIIPPNVCKLIYKDQVDKKCEEKIDLESQFCASSDAYHKSCHGDHGGTAVCGNKNGNTFVCGVTSISSKVKDIPNVYTNVAYFQNWIQEKSKNQQELMQ